MFNIMNLNNIENIFYWTDNNGAVSLPGDTALTYRTKSDLPRFVAAVYSALNTDSGVSERVVTLNGHCGLLLDVLYDKDWVSETFSNLNCEIPDEIIMNLFGAALPCLAQIMWNDAVVFSVSTVGVDDQQPRNGAEFAVTAVVS